MLPSSRVRVRDNYLPGSAQEADTSLSGLMSTLIPLLIIAGAYLVLFLVLRERQRRFYAPRTYLGSLRENERTPALPSGLFNWIGTFTKMPYIYALHHQSLDAYLFLRFIRVSITICIIGVVVTWPVLLPINITGGNGKKQLSVLTWSNIKTSDVRQTKKLYGHALIAVVYYSLVLYTIMRELIFYINIRQAYLLSPGQASRMSNRTVLFASVPVSLRNEVGIRAVFGKSVKRVWFTGGSDFVDKLVAQRNKTALKLEKAEIKLLKTATINRARVLGKSTNSEKQHVLASSDVETGNLVARWVPDRKRPTHKIGFLGLMGRKVDTIYWCREELARLIPESMAAQEQYARGDHEKGPAVFVEFHTQAEAQAAFQTLSHHHALQMDPRYIGVRPDQVVWSALNVRWWQRVVLRYLVLAFITALIILWAFPVVLVASLTNIAKLQEMFKWLRFLSAIPSQIQGLITGLLPSVLMAILFFLVPVIMRLCAQFSGEPTMARLELFTQNAYFFFQLINVFLVTSIASGITPSLPKIYNNPGSTTTLLAENLPLASNFYVSYFIFQALGTGVAVMVQFTGLIIFNLLYKLVANTPRAMYSKWSALSEVGWGTTMPTMSLLTIICLVYATIAPLVSGVALVGLTIFYLAYKYNVLFVTDTITDTSGLLYPRALKQLLAGVYLAELCMLGLLGISKANGPLVIIAILLVATIFFHISMFKALNPLLYALPLTLQARQADVTGGKAGDGDKTIPTDQTAVAQDLTTDRALMKGNFLMRWLKPWVYCDYDTLQELFHNQTPLDVDSVYREPDVRFAYNPPSVGSKVPLLWIPQDTIGVSKQEMRETSKVIPITDEQSTMDAKGKIHWQPDVGLPPLWEEKIEY